MELLNSNVWSVIAPQRHATAGGATPREWLRGGLRIDEELVVRPASGEPVFPPLELAADARPGERSLLLVEFASGAVEFFLPEDLPRNGKSRGASSRKTERFNVAFSASSPVRRGGLSQTLRLLLVRISSRLVDAAARRGLPRASRLVEHSIWRRAGLREGWHRIRAASSGALRLERAAPRLGSGRVLLLLHGTFSSTLASFSGLLTPPVFRELERLYPGGLFGFEHFSFSRSLEENLESLVRELGATAGASRSASDRDLGAPGSGARHRRLSREASNTLQEAGDRLENGESGGSTAENGSAILSADVVGYSRGGLLARILLQRKVVNCRRLVLCATPNLGTPLASGERWRESLGWLANLLELCPDEPLLDGAELVLRGAIWLATRLTANLLGLADMRPGSELLEKLGQSTPPVEACYALVANYEPDGNALERLLDLGSDWFFSQPNDLVVPVRGGWELGMGNERIGEDAIACFGPGGNLRSVEGDVQHLNLLSRPECGELLQRALAGEPLRLPPLDRRMFTVGSPSRSGAASTTGLPTSRSTSEKPVERGGRVMERGAENEWRLSRGSRTGAFASDRSLQIMILGRPESIGFRPGPWQPDRRKGGEAIILATYGGARVFQPFALSGRQGDTQAGRRFQRIISIHEKINERLAGRRDRLPSARELRELGEHLFVTLFSGPVKSLYEVARTEQGTERLNIIITCSIPWLAGKPWELAWDPLRRKFLATEEVHFVRSVFTAVPAQSLPREQRPLRILIVEAQPADTAVLSIEEERKRILNRFRNLSAAGAAEVSVLVAARPESLHDRLVESSSRGCPFDIVHFIGHGDFDSQAREGCLLFLESEGDQPLAVGVQTLRELLCNRGLQLVFLNACDTARQPGARDRGIAQSLVEGGLPAVVANQFPVLDPSALAFAERFYWGLAQGNTLGAAAREARIAINYSAGRDAIDWAVPVLYARDPDAVLCRPPERSLEPLPDQPRLTGSQWTPRGARLARVGIADLSRGVADLGEILRKMNAAQEYFEFHAVQLGMPLDVWRRERDGSSGRDRTFLVANELAERLRGEVERLGVDYLAGVTNWWVSESAGGDQNLFGWWSDQRDCPIFVLSTAGLELAGNGPQLTAESGDAYRVIVNEFVACCGGFLHDAHVREGQGIAHLDGPLDSLFRYDPDRNSAAIRGPLRIHEPQRSQLLATLPRRLYPAKLLATFDRLLESS